MVAGSNLRLRTPQACWPLYPRIFATVPGPCLCAESSSFIVTPQQHDTLPSPSNRQYHTAAPTCLRSRGYRGPGCVFANAVFQLELGMDESPLPLTRIQYSVERSARVSTRATPARRCHHGKIDDRSNSTSRSVFPPPIPLPCPGDRHQNSRKARIGTR